MTMVYLGGAIDLTSKDGGTKWRERFSDELAMRKISSFNPASAFRFMFGNKRDADKLININKDALLTCDFAVFVMRDDVPSIGTPIELFMASENGIPHVVIWNPTMDTFKDNDGPDVPDSVKMSKLPAYVHGFADRVVFRFDDALDEIVKYHRISETETPVMYHTGCNLGDISVHMVRGEDSCDG